MPRILFVCLGNICRSPLAEGVFRRKVEEAGLGDQFEIDSAGIGPWHVGDPPDRRMQKTAQTHGLDISGQRGRQLDSSDFNAFDHIFAMDRSVLRDTLSCAPGDNHAAKVTLFRELDPEADGDPASPSATPGRGLDVPDPYYGGAEGFERVYEIVDRTCEAILEALAAE